jgi:cytochrome c556
MNILKFPSGPEELERCYTELRLILIKNHNDNKEMEQKFDAAMESVNAVLNTVEAKLEEVESKLDAKMEECRKNADKLGWLQKVSNLL